MIRYYLVPAVPDPEWEANPELTVMPVHTGLVPKYLNQMVARLALGDNMQGILPAELVPDGQGYRQWMRNWFIIRFNIASGDFSALDSISDVQHITRQKLVNNITKLNNLGINTTGLTLTTPRKAIERRLNQWLQNRDIDFSQATGRDEVID